MKGCPTKEKLGAYLLDELGIDECKSIDAHVDSCERCQREMASLCEDLVLGPETSPSEALAADLLFGLLALHNSFVTRDDLIAATSAWLKEKSLRIPDILVERGRLSEEERMLVDALVEKHLEKHGVDLTRTLAEVSSLQAVQAELEAFNDADLEASLDALGRWDSGADRISSAQASVRAAHATDHSSEHHGESERFTALYSHAKGGLGEVFVAHDQQLDRNVALKRMQARHADNYLSRFRFELEAEVTGKLEHPGIVPVYSKGADENGRPFYAMRLIRGNTFKKEIDEFHRTFPNSWRSREARLTLRGLLQRLIAICNAIEYAHHRGVLHRDLKPANVMLGKFGETMVVDWGLAKTGERRSHDLEESSSEEQAVQVGDGSGTGPTTMGTVVGTLGYMSPEQASGKPEEVGPSSDIYSLGAILYRILTGRSSQQSNSDKLVVLAQIEQGKFARPRELKLQIPRPLESICLKAMALSPADRYDTARSMAEDIESWFADERVEAHPERLVEKSLRLMRRYRGWVATAVGLLLLFAAAVVVAFAVRDAERSRIQSALSHRQVREIVDTWLTGAAEDLRDLPPSSGLRQELMRKAVVELESLDREGPPSNPLPLDMERALSRMRIGELQFELGGLEAAAQCYAEAKDLFSPHRGTVDGDLGSADSLTKLAGLASDRGEDPIPLYSEALTIYDTLTNQHPRDDAVLDARGTCLSDLAMYALLRSDLKNAEQHFTAAIESFERALDVIGPAQQADRPTRDYIDYVLQGLCLAERGLGDVLLRQGREFEASESHFATALALSSRLRNGHPDDRHYIELHADTRSYYANLLRKSKRYDDELEQRRTVLSDYSNLLATHEWVRRYQESVARANSNLAQTHRLRGEFHEANSLSEQAKTMFASLVNLDNSVRRYRVQLAAALDLEAQASSLLGNQTHAILMCKEAAGIFDAFTGPQESNDEKHRRANNLRTWGEVLHRLGEHKSALEKLEKSIRLLNALDDADPFGEFREDLKKSRSAKAAVESDEQ